MFDMSLISSNADALWSGFWLTVRLCLLGIGLGLLAGGLLLGMRQLLGPRWQLLYEGYVTLFRGTPLLVQLYLAYYGGPYIGLELS